MRNRLLAVQSDLKKKKRPPLTPGGCSFLAFSSFWPIFSAIDAPRAGLHLLFGQHTQWGPPAKTASIPYLKWLLMGCSILTQTKTLLIKSRLTCDWWRFWYLVVPFSLCGTPLLGCLLAWTLVLQLCFFFSPFLGCFLFIRFGRVSSG